MLLADQQSYKKTGRQDVLALIIWIIAQNNYQGNYFGERKYQLFSKQLTLMGSTHVMYITLKI